METKMETFNKQQLKAKTPDFQAGDIVKVYQKVKEQDKERIQVFEGVLLAKKHGKGVSGTITVRKISQGLGVERVFPLHSPLVEKIEVTRKTKVRQGKLYYLRSLKGKKARLKAKEFALEVPEEPVKKEQAEEKAVETEPAK
ncbi:MAG: 50S ribosomal protein L19 [Candidatus Wildermuthbacteria bacterium RIFCSPHIGHO2_02_FULL_47_12]|uniref:Large ribosomal subunit protein bL19 n=1 Tax=Candidatus Wildermuthbacteria bacterium RIFCSPHIGHO2_02_FULL_47_12 TaxID=1802451 RepID=A0A1G2R2N0_9BACT|nr:MAG: 50S ribosomal protein L19 [Candidatus Wildermuthbacteria bacterium RIFCSPHIGHO2_02_FULL_47_12]